MFGDILKCIPTKVSATELVCETEPVIAARRRLQGDKPLDMIVSWDSDGRKIIHEDTGFEMDDVEAIKAIDVQPRRISPIALKKIVITLDLSYPGEGMTKDDFSVEMIPESLEKTYLDVLRGGRRPLNVIEVDPILKTITVKYGGAYSGTYGLLIKSKVNGNVDTIAIELKVVFEITKIEPTEGSILGGTKLTITGGPFTPDLKETIVKVGFYWWEPIDHYCYVIAVTENQVQCRLPLDHNREAKEYEVIAFASTFEEANCEFKNCLFTFKPANELPTVTGFSTQYDIRTNEWTIVVTGTGFSDSKDKVEFFLDDTEQTVLQATGTKVVINVDEVKSAGLKTNKMDLYFSVGLPNGYTQLTRGVKFSPKLVSLSTNTVSEAGGSIQAHIRGMGVDDELTLINATSKADLCLEAYMIAPGVLECELDPSQDFSAGPVDLEVKEKQSGNRHSCANQDKT
jgi:hypothetical protein